MDVAACLATVQLSRTSAHITASMGYSGIDAYADALDACHFMSGRFARYLLRTRPRPEKLAAMAARGRLEAFGISPTDIDIDRLRTALAKLDGALPTLSSRYSMEGTVGERAPGSPSVVPRPKDEARLAFTVSRGPERPRAADEAHEHRLSRRGWATWMQERRIVLAAIGAAAAVFLCWCSARVVSHDLSTGLVVLAGLMGVRGAFALSNLLNCRAEAFFRAASELGRYPVLQGRRDPQFLAALRRVRPDVFAGSRHAGLPRLVTVLAERNGILLLGRGPRPRIVAAFHWLHVPEIVTPRMRQEGRVGRPTGWPMSYAGATRTSCSVSRWSGRRPSGQPAVTSKTSR
ncbi:hypothetical protein ACX80W_03360 [Arthrobacter sp. TMN-37]